MTIYLHTNKFTIHNYLKNKSFLIPLNFNIQKKISAINVKKFNIECLKKDHIKNSLPHLYLIIYHFPIAFHI